MTLLAVQAVVAETDIPVATAVCLFFQELGPTLSIAIAQAMVLEKLLPKIREINPQLSTQDIIEAGATRLRNLISASDWPRALKAYTDSLSTVYVFATVFAVL